MSTLLSRFCDISEKTPGDAASAAGGIAIAESNGAYLEAQERPSVFRTCGVLTDIYCASEEHKAEAFFNFVASVHFVLPLLCILHSMPQQ